MKIKLLLYFTLSILMESKADFSDLVRRANELALKTATNVLNAGTALPILIARALNLNGGVPTLINPNNIQDFADRVLPNITFDGSNEDAYLNFTSLVIKYGRKVEEYTVATEDGYLLKLFRIPPTKATVPPKPPVFVQHGLLGSADDWLLMGNDSLPYLLADVGHDVWIGNARGNKYSRRHVSLTPSSADFWDFSWHEIGIFDLPAFIDFVLKTTGEQQLCYVGHSQGTTSFFVMASERADYGAKVALMVALSPVAYMSHAKSPFIRLLSIPGPVLHALTKLIGIYEFLPPSTLQKMFAHLLCGGENPISELLCSNIIFIICGFSYDQLDPSRLPVMYGHWPAGAATKQLIHYAQGVITGDFRKFDYGPIKNYIQYDSRNPPEYKIENIVTPAAFIYAKEDWLAHPTDVGKLAERMGKVTKYKVPNESFNHMDFVIGKDVKTLVYDKVIELFGKIVVN